MNLKKIKEALDGPLSAIINSTSLISREYSGHDETRFKDGSYLVFSCPLGLPGANLHRLWVIFEDEVYDAFLPNQYACYWDEHTCSQNLQQVRDIIFGNRFTLEWNNVIFSLSAERYFYTEVDGVFVVIPVTPEEYARQIEAILKNAQKFRPRVLPESALL